MGKRHRWGTIVMSTAAGLHRASCRLGRQLRRLGWRRRVGLGLLAFVVLIGAGLVYREWTAWPVRVALRQPGDYWPMAFSPDGAMLATARWQTGITVWDLAEGRVRATWPPSAGGNYVAGRFAPDGRTFAAHWLGQDAQRMPTFGFDLIDVASGSVRVTIPARPGFCFSTGFTDGGKLRLVVGDKVVGEVVDHDVATGSVIARRSFSYTFPSKWFPVTNDGRIMALALFPPGAVLGTQPEVDVMVWDLERDREVARLPGRATDFAFSGDGTTLAVGRAAGPIALWDFRTGRIRETRGGHPSGYRVDELVFTPDSATLVSVGCFRASTSTVGSLRAFLKRARGGNFRFPIRDLIVLDVASGRRLGRIEFEGHAVFSPDGRSLATTDATFINVRDIPGRR